MDLESVHKYSLVTAQNVKTVHVPSLLLQVVIDGRHRLAELFFHPNLLCEHFLGPLL